MIDPVHQLIVSLSFVPLSTPTFSLQAKDAAANQELAQIGDKASRAKAPKAIAAMPDPVDDKGAMISGLSEKLSADAATSLSLVAESPQPKHVAPVTGDTILASMPTSTMPNASAVPGAAVPVGTQLLNAMARANGVDQQWLEGVATDIERSSQNGDVRFKLQPADLGNISVSIAHDGVSSHLTIAVAEPRALSVVAQAHHQMVAGALALGVPISGASVSLDQSSADRRSSGERARRRIEIAVADEGTLRAPVDRNRYA
ncbi:flagellar hook-length control protein FliK (plasmid) [Sphingomonas paeninsulae]|uniref:Flagellar hook-length control protein FliK n=1 Tax=Sphingomonas paeninsulae TaxID=2319844 RepID=A0A494TD51_SPHPE|nr:flagellar hook-length control protein FliK [Sphingomonas paeninsulae]